MAALSWSNVDYFTRNIGTIISGGLTASEADDLLASMRQANNAGDWTWPTGDDFRRIAELDGHPEVTGVDSTIVDAVETALAAAISVIARQKDLPVYPVDSDGNPDPAGDPPAIGADVFLATILHANKLYRQIQAPDGAWGSGDGISTPVGLAFDAVVWGLLWEPPSL